MSGIGPSSYRRFRVQKWNENGGGGGRRLRWVMRNNDRYATVHIVVAVLLPK